MKANWQYGINPKGVGHNRIVIRPAGEFPHGLWIADCGNDDDESVARARLMAAAPQLLDSLQTAIRWLRRLEQEHPGCLNDDAIAKHLEPAIFKATAAPAAM